MWILDREGGGVITILRVNYLFIVRSHCINFMSKPEFFFDNNNSFYVCIRTHKHDTN